MHIVQLLPELTQGGVEYCVIELSRELSRQGHRSTVISAGGRLSEQIEADGGQHITFDLCSKNPLTAPKRIAGLRALLSKLKPDLVHAHSRVPAWLFTFANRTLRIPLVTTVHGFNHISPYSRVMTRGDRVICGSNSIKEHVLKNYPVDEKKLRYVAHGIDSKHFDPETIDQSFIDAFKQQHRLENKTVITIVGRITEWKGHDTFIRALAEVQKTHPDVIGVVAGNIWHNKQGYFRALKKLATDLNTPIRFVGSQTQVREIYALSDLVVSAASSKAETFGRAAAEALAMNTPVVASAHGGSLDILIDGENGLLFEPGNERNLTEKIKQALNTPFRNMRSRIKTYFTLDQMVTQTLRIYENLVSTLHIVQVLPELNQGGVERGVVEFNRELVKRGHRSTVISAGGKQSAQIEKDGGQHITLDICSKNPLTFLNRAAALRRVLSDLRPSILHARSRVPAWLCLFANKRLKSPFITTVHGFNSVSRYSEIMVRGDRVLYGSSSIKEYILKNYPVDETTLRYVPRGIDMELFNPQKVDTAFIKHFKKQHGLEEKTIITIVGRITEWKGHDTFIRALAQVQKNHSDVVGVAAGGIWHGKEEFFQGLEKLAAELGADIRFVGSQTQVREIYALSDLVVSAASTKAETFGRTAAEALAMNTPVIASAHGGSLDILIDGENGLLFEPGNAAELTDKIEQALSRPFKNMRPHIEKNFSLTRMTEDELSIYNELI